MNSFFRRGACRVLACLLAVLTCRAAEAQTLLDIVVRPHGGGDYVVRVDPDGPRVLSSRPVTDAEKDWRGGIGTSDGRFIVGLVSEMRTQFPEPVFINVLTIHDLVSGSTVRLPKGSDFAPFAMHPRRTEIVGVESFGAMVLGPGGQRWLSGCSASSVGVLSGDGARAIFQCVFSGTYQVIDIDQGGAAADLGISYGMWPVLSPDGRIAYDLDGGQIRGRAVASGVELGRSVLPGEQPQSLAFQVHPRTGTVFVAGMGLHAFDGAGLALARSRPGALLGAQLAYWVFDPDRARIYAIAFDAAGQPSLVVIDSDTLEFVSRTPVPGPVASVAMRRVPTPAAPASLAAAVQGSSVQLTWAEGLPVAQSLRYVLEAGSGPGLNDLIPGLDMGLQTSLTASGVPPGRYYVRVRAGNYAGLSAPSNEVVVQVP
jgi:hypothetical protein